MYVLGCFFSLRLCCSPTMEPSRWLGVQGFGRKHTAMRYKNDYYINGKVLRLHVQQASILPQTIKLKKIERTASAGQNSNTISSTAETARISSVIDNFNIQ
ncbi:hypothetical protein F5Y06DRAFT_273325 [Hypoxylon sp. FL0890]|nr:hypothetical protein F5Y06DRAFT_273325 [Hypoxylon sp. FL0890]